MKRFQIGCLLLLIVAACKPLKIMPFQERVVKIKDTVYSTFKVIDTLKVIRNSDTTRVELPVHKVTSKPIVKKSKHATLKIQKVDGQLKIECIADELREVIEIQKETINHYRELYEKEHEKTVVEQTKIPSWVKPFFWIGLGVIAVTVVKLMK
ncbi:hypothetical protein [Wenyingzhuangia sp. IMCC45574]